MDGVRTAPAAGVVSGGGPRLMVSTLTIPRLTPDETEDLRPREPLTILAWARRYLRITEGPLLGDGGTAVPWVEGLFPLQTTILEAIDDPRWRRVWLLTSPQAFGKTQCAAIPPLLHALEHRRTSALYVGASEPLAVTQWRKKIAKAMQAHPDLAALLPIKTDEAGAKARRDFTNGTSLHFAGSESVGNLSAFTVAVVVCDDLQAWPATLPGFGHPADIAWARAGAYPGEAVTTVGMGTASTVEAYLWQSLVDSAFFCPFVPCLGCGTYQLLEFERLEYPENVTEALEATALRCVNLQCDHRLVWAELPEMLAAHRWVSLPPGKDWITAPPAGGVGFDGGGHFVSDQALAAHAYPDTERVTRDAGFWCSALYWPFGETWGQRAADWLGRRGNPDREKDFQQTVRVVPWQEPEEDEDALTEAAVATHRVEGHRRGTVPAAADLLTMTQDVHATYLYYSVRAWCRDDGSSWLVDAGTEGVHGPRQGETLSKDEQAARVGAAIRQALEALAARATEGWPVVTADGEILRIVPLALGLVDGSYRPDAVWQFCVRANSAGPRRWHMIMGVKGAKRPGPIWPARATRTAGRDFRWIHTDEAKHELRALLAIPAGRPGAWHTYADESLEAYHRHMVSEHFVLKNPKDPNSPKVWKKRAGAGANHWWDCEVYQIAAAIAGGVKLPSVRGTTRRVVTDWFKRQKAQRKERRR